jgi:hypothetical protein
MSIACRHYCDKVLTSYEPWEQQHLLLQEDHKACESLSKIDMGRFPQLYSPCSDKKPHLFN